MTEEQWLECVSPEPMLELVRVAGGDRKLRLFACACSRRIGDLFVDASSRAAIDVAERLADGLVSRGERAATFAAAAREAASWTQGGLLSSAIGMASASAAFAVADPDSIVEEASAAGGRADDVLTLAEVQYPELWPATLVVAALEAAHAASAAASGWALAQAPGWDDGPEFRRHWEAAVIAAGEARATALGLVGAAGSAADFEESVRESVKAAEDEAQCELLRDIFGNPFRTAALGPAWRTDTAVSLAKGMYGSRDFSAMPILADALQDAGCANEDILNHCRDEKATHVRGCWVVDLVLGKE
jgi:hypothetical protein